MKPDPFFILGCPRSGTTLLQLLIDSYTKIAIPPESHIFSRYATLLDTYGKLSDLNNLRIFVRDLLSDYRIRDWSLNIGVDEFIQELETASKENVIELLFELYARRHGKQRWGDKTPQHMLYLSLITNFFPNAKFIHLIRDGRDVAVSSSRTFVGPASIYGIARVWRKYIFAFHEFKRNLAMDQYLEVYYENLVRNPQNECNRIFHFLKERPVTISGDLPDTETKQHYIKRDLHMHSLEGRITDKKIGTYRRRFSKRQIEIFETVAGDALKLHNYSLLTDGKAIISFKEKVSFFIRDYVYRYYRKYFRPSNPNEVVNLFKEESQIWFRRLCRGHLGNV